MTPAAFAKRMEKLAKLAQKNIWAGFRAVAIVVDQTVVLATPVDTGRARSNWRVNADVPNASTRDPYKPGAGGSTAAANAQAAIAQGKSVILSTKSPVIYISNNLPYIEALNAGSSVQAPAGFVERAVQAGRDEVARINVFKGA